MIAAFFNLYRVRYSLQQFTENPLSRLDRGEEA